MAADVLLLGSRGTTGLARAFTGSTSTALVNLDLTATLVVRVPIFVQQSGVFKARTASRVANPCSPCLTPIQLPTEQGDTLAESEAAASRVRHIGICLDGSDASGVLLSWSLGLLLRPEDRVTLLFSPHGLDDFSAVTGRSTIKACEAELCRFLDSSEQVSISVLASDAEAGTALLREVEQSGPYDLLLVGSRGLSPLKRTLERLRGGSSVSAKLLADAPCPVLVVSKATLVRWLGRAEPPKEAAASKTVPAGTGLRAKSGGPAETPIEMGLKQDEERVASSQPEDEVKEQ
jgi:nucleotide-binding universal stress UspA family protein